MGLEHEQLKNELAAFSGKYGPAALVTAIVKVINSDDTVAIEFSNGATVDDARLKAVVKAGNKIILTPAINSVVLVGRIENSDEWVVVAVDEIDKATIEIGSSSLVIDTNTITMNGGSKHGLTTRDGVKAQLNKLEADLNQLKTAFNAWTPVPNDGGAALKTASLTWAGANLTATANGDIENTSIKQ